jgi:hypothetical protein
MLGERRKQAVESVFLQRLGWRHAANLIKTEAETIFTDFQC